MDLTFPAGSGPDAAVRDIVALPDGRLLIAGDFDTWDGMPAARVVRVFPDGRLDPSFRLDLDLESPLPRAAALLLGADGRIYVTFRDLLLSVRRLLPDGVSDPAYPGVVQPMFSFLLSDGSLLGLSMGFNDSLLQRWGPSLEPMPGFQHRLMSTYVGRERPGTVDFASLDGEGRLLLKGGFSTFDGVPSIFVRLRTNGTLDADFAPEVAGTVFRLLPDGRFLHLQLADWPLARLGVRRTTGEFKPDPTYRAVAVLDSPYASQPGPLIVRDVAWQADGKYLLAGSFATVNGGARPNVVRLHADGVVDEGFDAGSGFGYGPGAGYSNSIVECVVEQAGGGILVGGEFRLAQGVSRPYVARLLGGPPGEPPHWLSQPASQTNDALAGAEFTASADGPGPIGYRWQRNGLDLPGRTNEVLRLPNLQTTDAGDYRVIAGNRYGSITSTVATLTVMPALAPSVTVEVLRVQASPGTSPALRALASGRPAPAIQWYRGSVPVPGATQAVWTVRNARAADSGIYHVVAVNPLGRVTGPDVTLQVSAEAAFPGRVDVGSSPPRVGGIRSLAQDSAGRLVLGGSFTEVGGVPRRGVARLFPDGRLDPGFDPGNGPSGGQTICCPHAESLPAGSVLAVATLPDDRVLVAGSFRTFAGRTVRGLVRLLADGSVDEAFAAAVRGVVGEIGPSVLSLLVQPDGNFVGGGYFTSPGPRLARWLSNGEADPAFHVGLGPTGGTTFQKPGVTYPSPLDGSHVRALARLADGALLAGGNFAKFDGQVRGGLVRLTAEGRVDTTYIPGNTQGLVRALAVDAAGRVYVGSELPGQSYESWGKGRVERLAADGRRDPTFAAVDTDSPIKALVVQRDGSVVIAGQFDEVNSTARHGIARMRPDGTLDTGFGLPMDPSSAGSGALLLEGDGSVWVAGDFEGFHGVPRPGLARLHGGPVPETPPVLLEEPVDVTVREGGTAVFQVLAASGGTPAYRWLHDGKILEGADQPLLNLGNVRLAQAGDYAVVASNAWGPTTSRWARLTVEKAPRLPGSVDLEFDSGRIGPPGGVPLAMAIALHPNGHLLLAASITNRQPDQIVLDRWHADATPATNGVFPQTLHSFPSMILVQSGDGRILVAPSGVGLVPTNGFTVTRFLPDGRVDPGFNVRVGPGSTEVRAIALDGDGSVLVGGSFRTLNGDAQPYLGRVDATGMRDPAFAPRIGGGTAAFTAPVTHLLVQPDGGVLVAGNFRTVNQEPRIGVARLLTNGQLDADFILRSAPDLLVSAMALDSRGRILVAFFNAAGRSQVMGRWFPDGSRDLAFQIPLVLGATGVGTPAIRALALDGRERIVIGGDFKTGEASRPFYNIARLSSAGALDTAWNVTPGANATVTGLIVTPDDGVYLVGSFTEVQGLPKRGVARLLGGAPIEGPRLAAPTLGAGLLRFTITTRSGRRYTVQTAEVLAGPWVAEGETLGGDDTARTLSVPVGSGSGARFVRVRED